MLIRDAVSAPLTDKGAHSSLVCPGWGLALVASVQSPLTLLHPAEKEGSDWCWAGPSGLSGGKLQGCVLNQLTGPALHCLSHITSHITQGIMTSSHTNNVICLSPIYKHYN